MGRMSSVSASGKAGRPRASAPKQNSPLSAREQILEALCDRLDGISSAADSTSVGTRRRVPGSGLIRSNAQPVQSLVQSMRPEWAPQIKPASPASSLQQPQE